MWINSFNWSIRHLVIISCLFIGAPVHANDAVEIQKLFPENATFPEAFGVSVDVSGDTAVVGAITGEGQALLTGIAYVYVRDRDRWVWQATLSADDGASSDGFGIGVAIDGDTVVVGATSHTQSVSGQGAAYVFVRMGKTWSQQAKLLAADARTGDQFGGWLDISGDTIVVGVPDHAHSETNLSTAYVYVRTGEEWSQQTELFGGDQSPTGSFGDSVSISGDTIVVGAPSQNTEGAAYVFVRDGSVWPQQQKLLADDGGFSIQFGSAVAIDGDTVIGGAPADLPQAAGSAFAFSRDGTVWTKEQKLIASDRDIGDRFGESVDLSGDVALIGAYLDGDLSAGGGSAYQFERDGSTWQQRPKLFPSDGIDSQQFGLSVAQEGEIALIGAPLDNEFLPNGGSAYVFSGEPILRITTLPDVNADGIEDIAVIREGSILAEIRSGSNGVLLKTITFLSDAFTPISTVALADADGNGAVELGLLATRNSDGRILVEIRNVTGAESPRSVWFAPDHTPVAVTVVEDDADDNGIPELAVLSTRDSDGRGLVEVKNAFGATNPRALWAGAGLTPSDVEVVADKDANGVPEIAVLSTRDSDGRIVVEIKNAAGATLPTAVWFAPGHTAIDLVAVDDKDSNGIPEVAVLSCRDIDGRNVVEIKNASGPTAPSAVWFAAGHTATGVHQVDDADNNGIPEVAVLSTRDSDGRILVEVKNAAGATNPNPVWYSSGFSSNGFHVLSDSDGNSIEEVLVLMRRNSDGRILVQGRNAAGSPAPKNYWFSP